VLTAYQRFETAVAFLLTAIVAIVIVIALGRLAATVFDALVIRALNPLDHTVFQAAGASGHVSDADAAASTD
jgi:hypothetical protein